MLDEPDGKVTAHYLALRVHHGELGKSFDILLKVEFDVYGRLLEQMQEYERPTE